MIESCGEHLKIGDLTIKDSSGDALSQELETVHSGLEQNATMIAASFLLDGTAKTLCSV